MAGMATTPYTRGLHEIGDGVYAYLQPDGSWGWSNAGLVVDGEASLLVDTLFDLKLTGEMLDTIRAAVPAARDIGTVVNTHANGDHCWGNQLVRDAEIVGSRACAEEMGGLPPALLAALAASPPEGPQGDMVRTMFGAFDFTGIEVVPPTTTFEGELSLRVGDTDVELIEVGPAHTQGDVIVHVPSQGVVYTGDILFNGGHPIVWAGPVANWMAACDRILALDAPTVVPGHGPVCGPDAVADPARLLRLPDRRGAAPRRGGHGAHGGGPRHRPRALRGHDRARAAGGQRGGRVPGPGDARPGRRRHPPAADGGVRRGRVISRRPAASPGW